MDVYNRSSYCRVLAYARGSEWLLLVGILTAVVIGAVYPVFSIFLSQLLHLMIINENYTSESFMEEANPKTLIFFLLGVLGLLLNVV
jgi:hypothetical protein